MTRRLLLIIFFGVNALTMAAQNRLSDSDDSIRQEATSNAIKGKLSTPFGAAALSNFVSGIHVSSFFKQGVNGNIELHKQFKAGWTGGLSLDQQIGSTDKEALPLSLTGVSPGTTIQFNLQKMFWHPGFDKLSDEQIQQLSDVEKAMQKEITLISAQSAFARSGIMAPKQKRKWRWMHSILHSGNLFLSMQKWDLPKQLLLILKIQSILHQSLMPTSLQRLLYHWSKYWGQDLMYWDILP
jgi:hypothetical protein